MAYEKLNDFVMQLMRSVSGKSSNLADIEEFTLAIMNGKEQKLKTTLTSPAYYPDKDWLEIRIDMFHSVEERIIELLREKIRRVLNNEIENIPGLTAKNSEVLKQFEELIIKMVTRKTSRRAYGNIVSLIENKVFERYLKAVYENRKILFRSLTHLNKAPLKTYEEARDTIYTSMLLLPVYDVSLPAKVIMPPQYGKVDDSLMSLKDIEQDSILCRNFLLKIREIITRAIPGISENLLGILDTAFYNESAESIPAVSGLLKIFYHLALDWKEEKLERGAESFTMSWIGVARANAEFYGYDSAIVDELYNITIEEDI